MSDKLDCPDCGGTGKDDTDENVCQTCDGTGSVSEGFEEDGDEQERKEIRNEFGLKGIPIGNEKAVFDLISALMEARERIDKDRELIIQQNGEIYRLQAELEKVKTKHAEAYDRYTNQLIDKDLELDKANAQIEYIRKLKNDCVDEVKILEDKLCEVRERIKELEDFMFAKGEMETAPCFCCGYNGPGYFDPGKHPCAERHHRLRIV